MVEDQRIINQARILKSDNGENKEYDRALVELVSYTLGIQLEESYKILEVKEWLKQIISIIN